MELITSSHRTIMPSEHIVHMSYVKNVVVDGKIDHSNASLGGANQAVSVISSSTETCYQ